MHTFPKGTRPSRLAAILQIAGLVLLAGAAHAQQGEIHPPAPGARPVPAQPAAVPKTAVAPVPAGKASAASAPARGVYRWTDANGKVHFGDRAPPNADRVPIRNDGPSAAETQAAQERVRAMQRRSDELAAERRGQQQGHPEGSESADSADAAPAGESACQAKWRAYEESYACFNPYRLANGGVRGEAYQHCKSVPRPEPCR